ncbi:hypothetical protein MBORA_16660 [Methanobrevibacter oralis]|uniref:Uncharacterized protein n=1 Tax=Methanobrevibacter oralis TaxID=66851 RepID=A0A165ZQP4_METOA|nr:hypothetical protein [Methanobrevibacter oralis]KZX11039.1 hypothetical protein MBORA_16660 [Methanobrevibacter oralis]
MTYKIARYGLILASFYYLVCEIVSAAFTSTSLFNTYIFHTIIELGI